jgi:hypothetical protein
MIPTTSKTYLELIAFTNAGRNYLQQHNDRDNKLCVAIRSVLKQAGKILDEYNERLSDCQLDNCVVDEATKIILKDEKGHLRFTVEGQKRVNKFQRELLEKEVFIEQRIKPGHLDLISSLTPDEKEIFGGIIIPSQEE